MVRYKCPKCEYKFTSNKPVMASLAWYSDGETRIFCPKCNKCLKESEFRIGHHARIDNNG